MKASITKLGARAATLALGAALLLPALTANAAVPYKAKNGDTFWSLAKKNKVTVQRMMEVNPNVDPQNVYAGLTLMIPSGAGSAKAKAKTAAAVAPKPAFKAARTTASDEGRSITTFSGETVSVFKEIDIKATAYSSAPEENGKWGAVDYFGNPLKLGTVAVDPKVIALGTKLYITGYDFDGLPQGGMYAIASDKGSAIVGKRIDIFVPGKPDYVNTFGVQNIKVYMLTE